MRIIKLFTKLIIACILLMLVLWAVALGTLQTKQGQAWAINHLVTYLENKTQTQVQIGKVDFSFPLNLHLEDVLIFQDNRPALSIHEMEICCAFHSLLQGKMIFSKVQASNIHVQQLFNRSQSSPPVAPRSWDTTFLPFYVKLENIDVQQVQLDQSVINALHLPDEVTQVLTNASLNFQGMMTNHPFRGFVTAHLLVTAKSHESGFTLCSLGIDAQNHQLSLSFHCHDFPLQLFEANFPTTLKARLALYASAAIDTWQKVAQNQLQEDLPIEGNFKLSLHSLAEEATPLDALIGQQTSLRSRYLLRSKRAIELFDFRIDNPHLVLDGEAVIHSDQKIDSANFKGEIENLEKFQLWLGKDIQGKLVFDGSAMGFLNAPSFIVHLESPHLLLSQQLFENVSSTLQITPENQAYKGFLTLAFHYQRLPWQVATFFDWNHQQSIELYQLQADAMGSHIEGGLTCHAPDYIWEGVLEAQIKHLNDITHFFDVAMNGDGQLKLQLAAKVDERQQRRQEIQAIFMGNDIQWKDLQAQKMTLHLDLNPVQENSKAFHIDTYLEGQQVTWGDYFVGHCQAHVTPQLDLTRRHLSHLSTEWKAQEIRWPAGQIDQAAGQAHLDDPLQTMKGEIQFQAQNIQTPTIQLEELIGSSTIHSAQMPWRFRINGRGNWKDHFLFGAEGNWHVKPDLIEVETTHLSGQFGRYPLQLLQPVYFVRHLDKMRLTGFHLQWGEAEIQGEFNLDRQNVFTAFKTNAIPSELFHYVIPDLPLAGRATFQGQINGPIHEPRGHFEIDLHRIQIIEDIFAQKPFITGRVNLDLNGKGILVNSELNGIGHTPLLVSGTLPVALNLDPFDVKIDSALPFHLGLNAEGQLDPYLHLFYNDATNLSGHAKIALRLSGQMLAPQIQGHIDLLNGAYESLSTGASYHNIEGHLEGDGSKIVLTHFSAQDTKQGSITATGTVHLDASKNFPFEFHIRPSRIFILDSDYVDISASGPLTLIGDTKKSKLQGELTVDQATVHLEETLPRQIKTVDVEYINLAKGELPPNYLEKKERHSSIELDIRLQAPQQVIIEGNHLKSEWKGAITVMGTPDNPQLHGDLRVTQGEYNFNGKVFNLTQGNIHFAGAPDKKTSLYVVASKEIDRIRADIIVKGLVTKPVISFRSNPPLSQREVLSYILFNRGISDITTDQGDQLSQSFISLNSSEQPKSSDDFLSRLRNNIGIDRLDFTTSSNRKDPTLPNYNAYEKDSQDIGLQVGKNITENISVTVNQSMAAPPVIAVEAKLRKNLKAKAESGVNSDAPVRMSLKWKKDY